MRLDFGDVKWDICSTGAHNGSLVIELNGFATCTIPDDAGASAVIAEITRRVNAASDIIKEGKGV